MIRFPRHPESRLSAAVILICVLLAGACAPGTTEASTCPHDLREGACPFCDESLVERDGFCVGHGVPEALCTRCRPELVAAFRKIGDWCAGHDVPESQCVLCNPELLDDARGGRPSTPPPPADTELIPAESLPRSLRPPLPTCTKQSNLVRFRSPEIAASAGLEYGAVARESLTRTLQANASIDYDGNRHAHLAPPVPGVVAQVHVDLGRKVRAGDVLASLHSIDLGIATTEFQRLSRTVETARAKVEQAESHFERVNRIEVHLTAADYLKARELLHVARLDYEREESLVSKGAESRKQLLAARADHLAADASCRALRKKLDLFGIPSATIDDLTWEGLTTLEGRGSLPPQSLLDARIELQSAEANLEAARKRLLVLGLSDDDIACLLHDHETPGLLPLKAPFDGEVAVRHAVRGELAEPSEEMFEIVDTSIMWAWLDLYEKDAAAVRLDQPVEIAVAGIHGKTHRGRITWISPRIDPKTRTLRARAEVPNPDGILRANMFGRGMIRVLDAEEAIVVPTAAVQWEGCCNVVFVRRSDTLFEPRKVSLSHEVGSVHVVTEGLAEGEVVVTTGSFLLKTELMKGSIGAGCCETVVAEEK
jgi:cobalt-zinc-cadmium efflux system membrane fusion protein